MRQRNGTGDAPSCHCTVLLGLATGSIGDSPTRPCHAALQDNVYFVEGLMRTCHSCHQPDLTVAYRERMPPGLRVLCAACHVDARSSSVRQVRVPERVEQDRYAQMAAKYGVR